MIATTSPFKCSRIWWMHTQWFGGKALEWPAGRTNASTHWRSVGIVLSKMKLKKGFASYTWMISLSSPRIKKISNDSPNVFSKASEKLTFTSNHQNANFAKWRSNTLALLSKKARWWWTTWNLTESATGWSPKALNKYAPSLDLETSIDALFRNSLNLPNPWTNFARMTNPLFGTMLPNKPLMKWRNASPKNWSSWCQVKPDLSRSNVMHWNMHLEQSLCNSTSMVIDTHVPSYHGPSPWQNEITKSMITNFYQWSGFSKNGNIISKDLHTKWWSIQITRTSHTSEAPRNSINNKLNGLFWIQH